MGAGYNERLVSLPPFMYVETHVRRGSVGVIAFGAYNALGLIGTEKGGVAIVVEPPEAFVLATKDIPWKPEERAEVIARLLKARTAVGVVKKAETEGGFDWRAEPKEIKARLTKEVSDGDA